MLHLLQRENSRTLRAHAFFSVTMRLERFQYAVIHCIVQRTKSLESFYCSVLVRTCSQCVLAVTD